MSRSDVIQPASQPYSQAQDHHHADGLDCSWETKSQQQVEEHADSWGDTETYLNSAAAINPPFAIRHAQATVGSAEALAKLRIASSTT